jgi:molybdopterin-containing oxidoreductase family iron-sulfur binding subunit
MKGLEVQFVAGYTMYDGSFANNGWLQELPDLMTKIAWDNAASLSANTAHDLKLGNEGMIQITMPTGEKLEIATTILPGQADGTVILPLGYGRVNSGKIGDDIGFDTYKVRPQGQYRIDGASAVKVNKSYKLAIVIDHHLIDAHGMAGRETRVGKGGKSGLLIRETNYEGFKKDKHYFRRDDDGGVNIQLFEAPMQFNSPHAWGMSIDMNTCTGCNACVIACQAENNIPIVGKEEVLNRRIMHWLRIDRYYKGDVNDPDVVHMPMMCVHCETAPCEQVCPVAATNHDAEGLNVMVYNRCVGTRYCSNNCPYKVRVFNFFDFHSKDPRGHYIPFLDMPDKQPEEQVDKLKRMVFNPEVTVRMRGVMEKCSYCSHRIQDAKIHAEVEHAQGKRESELVQDGEIATACEAACPTHAIVFGNLNDPESRVSKLQKRNRSYRTLNDMNLRERTLHMGLVRNPSYDKYAAGEVSPSALQPQHTQQENS